MDDEVEIAAGGCLCGAIRYRFPRASVLTAAHCHCTDCQKATGSGKATIVFLPTEVLELEGSCKTYTVIGTDGSHVTRGFCPDCGSPIISYVTEVPAVKFIKAGSLDDPSWVAAQSSYWNRSAVDWSPVDPRIPSFPGNPPAN
ncbi:MAG: GFA family protein [Gammaproteobacteria bacterium]|nr:GFA family protein [Gammaproteobacteria bacterium]